jgi:hypothetical protein
MARLRLLESLMLCGLFAALGCQNAPPQSEAMVTEPERREAAQIETQPTQTAVVEKRAPKSASSTSTPVRKQQRVAKSTPEPQESKHLPVSTKYTLPPESQVSVRLIDSISTATNKAGDTFVASLAEPLVVDGVTLFSKDTSVSGKIISLQEPGRVSGVASISLQLTEIQPRNGSPVALETQPLSETAKAEKKKDAAIIGGGTAIGTAIGAIAGGKRGAAIGAIAGGGSSTGYVLATKGKQLSYPSETLMTFKLAEPLTVTR